jgi:hypothetical protein
MARSTREEKKTTEEQSTKNQIVWLLMQMGVVVNDIINIKQQITILGEKRSCQHEAIARNSDACRTPPHQTNTGRAPRTRTPKTPPTHPTIPPRTTTPREPLMPLSSNTLSNQMSCQHEAIARNSDACRTPPHQTNTGRAPRTRTPKTPPTPPTIPLRTTTPLEPIMPLSPLSPRPTPAAVSLLPSLSPLSPLYSIPLTELIDLLGPDFDIDLEIERNRYQKKP